MFIESESSNNVSNRIRQKLSFAGLNAFSTGSKVRTIIDAFLLERIDLVRDIRSVASKAFLSTTDGGYLDLMGEDFFGLPRLGESLASATEVDGNINIFALTGTLSDHLPADGGGSYVPIGMEIRDPTGNFVFITDKKLYVENAATQAFVSASAQELGQAFNIPAGILNNTSISNIAANNYSPITNGQDGETDENYRYRISKAYVASEANNLTAIRLASLTVPGVADVIIRNFRYGPGTVQVLVIPEGNSVSNSVINRVAENINAVKSKEVAVFVDAPDYISVAVEYSFSGRALTMEERSLLENQVRAVTVAGVSSATTSTVFNPSNFILSALRDIVGVVGRVEKLCINGRPIPEKRYTLAEDEVLILDITEQEPIRVYA